MSTTTHTVTYDLAAAVHHDHGDTVYVEHDLGRVTLPAGTPAGAAVHEAVMRARALGVPHLEGAIRDGLADSDDDTLVVSCPISRQPIVEVVAR